MIGETTKLFLEKLYWNIQYEPADFDGKAAISTQNSHFSKN